MTVRNGPRPDTVRPGPDRIVRLPGVYRPQEDTHLLCAALASLTLPRGSRVLDYCTGSGAVAVAAARRGADRVVAVDVSVRAAVSAWTNARLRRLPIEVRRGGLDVARRCGPYDVVLANPPYVPVGAGDSARRSGCWDAGPDGRDVVGPLCREARALLRPGGVLLIVHSEVTDPERTLAELRANGVRAGRVRRALIPFGPVMRSRAAALTAHGLIAAGQAWEEVVVIRGDRPAG
ncbi:methyltransferase [Rhodococcus sp. NPDC058532]|uniref:methyltransferase n=1 Tax=Rhodococcus sp. NPDC058532 TaxID=3346540 RepID=UPI003658BC1B